MLCGIIKYDYTGKERDRKQIARPRVHSNFLVNLVGNKNFKFVSYFEHAITIAW